MAINPKRNFDESKPTKVEPAAEEVFLPEEPKWSLDDIILPQAVREKILDVANYSDNAHRVFELWGFKHTHKFSRRIGINLYGAPGTGFHDRAQIFEGNAAVLCSLLNVPLKDRYNQIKQDNTCVNVLEYSDGKWEIRLMNSVDHLGYLYKGQKKAA